MDARNLIENFDIIAGAPNGVNMIRTLIVDLATSGRLVEQRDDEGGSIERPTHPDAMKLHTLPASWSWVALGSTGRIFSGDSTSASEKARLGTNGNGIPYIATKDVGYGREPFMYDNGLLVNPEDLSFKRASANSVFICLEGGSAGRKMGISDQEVCFGNKLLANETHPDVMPEYILCVYLSTEFQSAFRGRMSGIIGGISKKLVSELPVPLPPAREQQRIVTKIDELMSLCDELEGKKSVCNSTGNDARRSSLDVILQAETPEEIERGWTRLYENWDHLMSSTEAVEDLRLLLMELAVTGRLSRHEGEFTKTRTGGGGANDLRFPGVDPARTWKPKGFFNVPPPGWTQFPLAALGEWGSGSTPAKANSDFYGGDVPWLVIGDLSDGVVTRASTLITEKALQETAVKIVPIGAVLVAMYGASIGKTGIAGIECTTNQAIAHCVPKEGLISTEYLHLLVRAMKRSLIRQGKGAAQPNISQLILKHAIVNIPTLVEQERILSKLNNLLRLCSHLEVALTERRVLANTIAMALNASDV